MDQRRSIVIGNVITMDPERPRVEALGIVGSRIVCVGTERQVRAVLGDTGVDAQRFPGGAIVPGFIDSHNHMLATAMQTYLLDLSRCRGIADVLDAVRDYAKQHPERPWIVGAQGWHVDELQERRYPTRRELDAVCRDRPVYLPRIYHAAACNSMALALAGIDKAAADPPGGRFVRDESGELTGELHEAPAMRLVERLVPRAERSAQLNALRDIQARYLSAGICSVIEPGLTAEEIALYEELWKSRDLTVRTVVMPLAASDEGIGRSLERFCSWPMRTGFGDSRLKLGGIKVFLDGGASLGTALMREPYKDRRCGCGIQVTPTPDFRQVVEFCAANKWSLGVHTVGGRAIDIALSEFKAASRRFDLRELRFSIIHAYLWPTPENIATARSLGIAIATQPSMQYQFAPILLRNFSREAIARATPLRSWLDGGVLVAAGSDAPTTPFEPMLGIWHAVTRYIDVLGETLGDEQAIGVEEALALYTRNAAWLSFSEHERGALTPGLEADWVALSLDPLECDKQSLRNAEIRATAVGGETVYRSGAAQ